jgi:methylphosphotriester-DNA--protein-cysteine methyltransferase
VRTFGVRFRPGGLAAFAPVPAGALAGCIVEPRALGGAPGVEVEARLREAPHHRARAGIVQRFLLARLDAPRAGAVQPAVREILRRRGRIEARALARHSGTTPRSLQRAFRRDIGLQPKVLARIVRFQNVLAAVERGGDHEWAQVALDCGYYDQAHLIRDFKQFTGGTPARFALPAAGLARHFATEERLAAFFDGGAPSHSSNRAADRPA